MNVYSIFPLAAAIIYVFLLIVVVAQRPLRRRHKLFAGFLAGALAWSIGDVLFRSTFLMDYKLILARITICAFVIMLLPFCHFTITFYEQRRDNWLVLAYFSAAANIVLAVLGYQPSSVEAGTSFFPHYNILLLVLSTALPFFILISRATYFLLRRRMLAENPLIHAQVTYLIATIFILGITTVSNILAIGRELPISPIGNLLAAFVLGYATLRHQLVDLKFVVWKGLVYGGITAVLAISYVLLLYIFQIWFKSDLNIVSISFSIGLAVVLTAAIYPLRGALQRFVEHLLYPATYDYRKTLLDFAGKASSIIDIDELGKELTTLVASAVSCKKAYLLLPEHPGGDYTVRFEIPETLDVPTTRLTLKADSPVIDWLKRTDSPLVQESLEIMPGFNSLWLDEKKAIYDAEAELFAPLVSRGNLVGIMVLSRKEPLAAYDMSDIELIRALTRQTAIAIENAQLHANIEGLAITDSLTHLFNRRHFDDRLQEEILREARHGGKFSLALIDLDGFKAYNDSKGHSAGDAWLSNIGKILKSCSRGDDIAFRYGGDEFALLMPRTPTDSARIVAERFRQSVATEAMSNSPSVTVSVGLASCPDDGVTLSEIVHVADRALYNAKNSGGNQVSTYAKMALPLSIITQVERESDQETVSICHALAAAVEAKDRYTYGHSLKSAALSVMLAKALGLSKEEVMTINLAAMLHDVGKMSIPDELLQKPGPLDDEQWKTIRAHPKAGANILSHVSKLSQCVPAVLYHHERYDGSGYPEGLKGTDIPLTARIVAIADAYAAMTSSRPHRDALPYDKVVEQLRNNSGTQFDPQLIEVFLNIAAPESF